MGALNGAKLAAVLGRLAGQQVYIDTNIFIFFLDRHDLYFPAVAPLIQACANQQIFGITGDLVVAEVMVKPYRQADAEQVAHFKRFFARRNFLAVVPHGREVFDGAAKVAGQQKMKLIDAVHFRTAMSMGCRYFLTHDQGITSSDSLHVVQLAELMD